MTEAATVSALYIYPVKSCRGIAVDRAEIGRRGFALDRRWMVVDGSGRFITQRDTPALCRVATVLAGDCIRLQHPEAGEFELPVSYDAHDELEVSVWSYRGPALRHAAASAWLSRAIGRECSLVHMAERHQRPVNPERGRPGDIVSFADGYPFLLISEESLADLNARLAEPLSMQRFRPNIVVRGVAPYAEDDWARLELGDLGFRAVKRCDRCVVTTLDPQTGEAGKEPLRTLARYRMSDGKVWFGMNLIHDQTGWLEVGASVRVAERATAGSH